MTSDLVRILDLLNTVQFGLDAIQAIQAGMERYEANTFSNGLHFTYTAPPAQFDELKAFVRACYDRTLENA